MSASAFDQAAAAAAPQQTDNFNAAAQAANVEETRKQPFFHLSIRCWLPEMGSKLHASMKLDKTQKGAGRVRFAAAPTGYNEEANDGEGGYLSGGLFNFEATDNGYGDLATAVLRGIASDERLVDIKAQYKPYQYRNRDGEKRTADKWFIVEMTPVGRRETDRTNEVQNAPSGQVDPEFQKLVDEANAAKATADA